MMDDPDQQQQQQAPVPAASTILESNVGSDSNQSASGMAGYKKRNQHTGPGPSSINLESERQLEDTVREANIMQPTADMNVDLEMEQAICQDLYLELARPRIEVKLPVHRKMLEVDMQMEQEIRGSRDIIGNKGNNGRYGVHHNIPTPLTWGHRVQEHGHNKDLNLLKEAYLLLGVGNAWKDKFTENNADIFEQRSPLENSVLHIAASYGNNEAVELVAQRYPKLLNAKNSNDDIALHVAARAKHISTLQKLLAAYFQNLINLDSKKILKEMLLFTFSINKQGNTIFHEALISGDKRPVIFRVLEAPLIMNKEENSYLSSVEADFQKFVKGVASMVPNREDKSILYLAIEAGCKDYVDLLLEHCLDAAPIAGKSPLLAAIMKPDIGILKIILSKKPGWIHLKDEEKRAPIHYAASIGYLEGVCFLLEKCASCITERDNHGFCPLHLASDGGHVGVVDELLKLYSLDPTEIVDNDGRNILHIAAESGRLNIVNYILKRPELEKMINQKDWNGNTPLHLASLRGHPRIVHALTWDKRVDRTLLNRSNETPLDAMEKSVQENPPLSQRLTWSALKSAGAPRRTVKISPQGRSSFTEKKAANMEQYKDRIDTLTVVSTLIITATFAAGFTMPGGNSDSDSDTGIANMINHSMFHLFIFSITVSMYGAISVTIILIWSRLGDLTLMLAALKVATPLLGITLGTLSLSFLAGVYLVISKLSWLATTFLVISAVFVFMVVLLYAFLFFPSASSSLLMRYISYYPFIILAKLAEKEATGRCNGDEDSDTFVEY